MWLRHSRDGILLDDGSLAFTHHQFDTRRLLPSFWYHGYWGCLYGLHVSNLITKMREIGAYT